MFVFMERGVFLLFLSVYFQTTFSFSSLFLANIELFVYVLLFQMKFSVSVMYQRGVCLSLLSHVACSLYDSITRNWIDKWMFNLRRVATSYLTFDVDVFLIWKKNISKKHHSLVHWRKILGYPVLPLFRSMRHKLCKRQKLKRCGN